MTDAIKTHYRTCNICEAMCGIAIRHRDREILSIRPDPDDPFSLGHICPKAVALQDFHADPDRVAAPMERSADAWNQLGWDDALDKVVARVRDLQTRYGPNSVAVYLGNPNAHMHGNLLTLPTFFKALGSLSRFSSASADQLPHHVAAEAMFGHPLLIPIPDVDRTDFLLIIGANPIVSNGSLMTAAGFPKRMRAIQDRGGTVVVIDPRRTETADKADQHFFIRPETDALLLLALVHEVMRHQKVNGRELSSRIRGLETLAQIVADFSPRVVADATGIAAAEIERLAHDFSCAEHAACYSRMGASTQSFGGLCQWLTNVLNIITGNMDREGGAMFTVPAFDLVGMRGKKGKPPSLGRHHSRVRGLPFANGEFPVATLAEEILSPGDGQIRGLITIAGNPVLSSPNGKKLGEALEQLEFMASVDLYLNETTRHADVFLPAATGLEVAQYDVIFNIFAVRNVAKYSPALFPPKGEQKPDWEIFRLLTERLSGQSGAPTPDDQLEFGLRHGPYRDQDMSLTKLREHPHGIDLGPLYPCLQERLLTADGMIDLAPDVFVADLDRLRRDALSARYDGLVLISRRVPRQHNTWTHNSYRLVRGKNPCFLMINPTDAARHKVADGDWVELSSNEGTATMQVALTDEVMAGVVCLPQGWGRRNHTGMKTAASNPGLSINDLTEAGRVDALTGNAAFNGTPVRLTKVRQKAVAQR